MTRPPAPAQTGPRAAVALVLAVVLAAGATAHAQRPPVRLETAAGEVTVIADRVEQIDSLVIATGNVEITRAATRLSADRVEIDRETGAAVAEGRVVFFDGTSELTGRRIEYNLKTGTGVVYEADARTEPYYRLRGERMERIGEGVYRVSRGTFTTCEDEPPDWSFRFGSARAELDSAIVGTGASFWVKRLPLLPFFPLFAAPLGRERESGFLLPKAGSSGFKGLFAEVPYYWAISDSQDATVALDVFTKRGAGGTGEYRYVLSESQRGTARGFWVNEFEAHGDNRAFGHLRHAWDIAPGFGLKVDASGVTDDSVFSNYGDQLVQRSAQRLESNVALTRSWPTWNLVADLFWYQDLTTPRPVELQRLPELSLIGTPQPLPGPTGVVAEVETSLVNFVRVVGSNGVRYDLHPQVRRPFSPDGLVTITPFAGARLTAYDKTVTGSRITTSGIEVETTRDEPRVRRLVEAGVDLELTASRVYAAGGWAGFDAFLHTVEPRVNYTWVAGEDQDRLPQWTDVDRIPNSSLVTYSLVNRLRAKTVAPAGTEPTRLEVVRLTLANAYDLIRQRVELATAELILRPTTQISLRGRVDYDVHTSRFETANTDVSVAVPRLTASIGTRYSEPGKINFVQGNVIGEIFPRLLGRLTTNTDLRTGTFVENRFGFDVRFQCWAFSVDYITRHKRDDELRFAVSLLGVGGPLSTSVGVGALGSTTQK